MKRFKRLRWGVRNTVATWYWRRYTDYRVLRARVLGFRPYWRHIFSRFKLRGRTVTWCFAEGWGWLRVGGLILRWGRL